MAFNCEECGAAFEKLSLLLQHRRIENHWIKYPCGICGKIFSRKDNLDRHMAKHSNEANYHCLDCKKSFSRPDSLQRHILEKHPTSRASKRPADNPKPSDVISIKRIKDDPRLHYTITKIKEQRMEKFKTTSSIFKISFKNIEITDLKDVLPSLERIISTILEDLTIGAEDKELIRLVVQSPSLDYPIVIPFSEITTLTAGRFMSEIERVLQSNEDFAIDDSLLFEVTRVNIPNGGSRKRCKYVNTDQFLCDKRCVIRIQNNDDLCCSRSIITAKAKLDQHEKWDQIRMGRRIQEILARELHEQANVIPGTCGIEEIKKFQAVLGNYQIHIVSKEHFNSIIYKGPEAEKKIYLYHYDNHYDVITSMSAFLSRNYYCTRCHKGYDNKEEHKCNNACDACHKIHLVNMELRILCNECNRFFYGKDCLDLHRKQTSKGNSTCTKIYRCKDCGKTINKRNRKRIHVCGDKYCEICKDYFGEDHLCYMKPADAPTGDATAEITDQSENIATYIFFDFECTQSSLLECENNYRPDNNGVCQNCYKSKCGTFEHIPNLCVAHKVCSVCMDKTLDCENCGPMEYVFRGDTTLEDFCKWLFSEENYGATVLCHNFQGYDSYPILQYLYKNAIVPTVIPNGAKTMCLKVPSCKIKMIDSINFLPMGLAKLPSMFGFSEMKKGYFPHLFNTAENQNVVLDSLPDIKYYNPDAMKSTERERFLKWYTEHRNDKFDFQREILEYCRSDTDILKRCCLRFREDFTIITGIDPFERCITIASACNLVFRTNFLQPETIAIIPHHGYKPEQKQSVKALQWMKYISHIEGHRIEHARNGGERRIGSYLVDGYYELEGGEKIVMEFQGDFWHGNPCKYARTTVNPVSKMTMGDLYDRMLEKQKYIENLGYTYRSIWESEFENSLNENPEMRAFVEDLDIVTPLEPRDAFYGGRTEAYTLYKEASCDERLDYYDVTSLYPFVNKTGKIPIGHPKIITENFQSVGQYEGLIKCKVVPPRKLFHPVLPSRVNGKLLFHLCKLCADNQIQMPCAHTDNERSFVGTWVTDEIKAALAKGYKILKTYEIWHFDEISQYDPCTQSGGLFTEYVNTFLKLKQEASGWPKWCRSEQDKMDYIERYYRKEGIRLDYNKIDKNSGQRALAKLMLNSFWGKFGQRSNMSQVEFVDDPSVYFDKLTSDREEVTAVNYVSNEIVEMRWKYKDDFVDTNSKTNVVIAAYTTAQARLKLYSYLEKLGPRALYADTDSIIFSSREGDWKPVLADYLGDLTNEIPDNEMQIFVTGGPKNYGYLLKNPDHNGHSTHCKVRGITLNHKNSLDVNFNVLKHFVTVDPHGKVTVEDAHKIIRDRDNAKILTTSQRKDYRMVFDKRVIRENFVSYPYGF